MWSWLSDFLKIVADLIPRPLIVRSDERVIAFVFGKHPKLIEPGWYIHWPAISHIESVNIKLQITSRYQRLNRTAYKWNLSYRVCDPMKLVLETYDYDETVADLVEMSFGDHHRLNPKDDMCDSKTRIAIQKKVKRELKEIGIDVERFSVSNSSTSDYQLSIWELQTRPQDH